MKLFKLTMDLGPPMRSSIASPGSFKVLRDGYAKDTWNVYFDGRKIKDASPGSFKVLRDGYAKDTWNTYYYGKVID